MIARRPRLKAELQGSIHFACLQVPEAERTRLREKMMKRREEQDAKALQEKLAASQVQRQEAAKLEAGLLCVHVVK